MDRPDVKIVETFARFIYGLATLYELFTVIDEALEAEDWRSYQDERILLEMMRRRTPDQWADTARIARAGLDTVYGKAN